MKRATLIDGVNKCKEQISIHALVKRATQHTPRGALGVVISIHALVKRATVTVSRLHRFIRYFNPRPREEGDAFITDVEYVNNISIHALVKRATCLKWHMVFVILHFNPRPREEGDRLFRIS